MSSRPYRALLLGLAVSAALVALNAGFAGAGSLEQMLQGSILPSAVPGLLDPIDENGRTGWKCKPEVAAAARKAGDADLPDVQRR